MENEKLILQYTGPTVSDQSGKSWKQSDRSDWSEVVGSGPKFWLERME